MGAVDAVAESHADVAACVEAFDGQNTEPRNPRRARAFETKVGLVRTARAAYNEPFAWTPW